MTIASAQSQPSVITSGELYVHRSSRFPKTVCTLCYVVILLLMAEGGLRLRAFIRYGSPGPVANIYELDANLQRRLRPGATLVGSSRHVSINSLGNRGPEITLTKKAGTIRVAAIGDSTTFGLEASCDDAVWVRQMERQLNQPAEKLPGTAGGLKFEAINAAVPGYTLDKAYRHLVSDIVPLDVDVVIVTSIATDIAQHSRLQFGSMAQKHQATSRVAQWLGTHSLLLNLLRKNSAAFRESQLPVPRHGTLDNAGIARYRETLLLLIKDCRSRGLNVLLCTWPRAFGGSQEGDQLAASALANNPALSLDGLNNAFDRYNDAIREIALQNKVALVDLDRTVPRGATYFDDAVHLNDAGHAKVGRLVAEGVANLVRRRAQSGDRF